jgi:hypothetical protein
VVGFNQGVLSVVRDDTGRAVLLVPPIAGTDGGRAAQGSGAARVTSLSAFAESVRALVEAGRSGRSRQLVPRRTPGAGPGCP